MKALEAWEWLDTKGRRQVATQAEASGMTVDQIAKKVGAPRSAILMALGRTETPTEYATASLRSWKFVGYQHQREAIAKAVAAGLTAEAIAAAANVTVAAIMAVASRVPPLIRADATAADDTKIAAKIDKSVDIEAEPEAPKAKPRAPKKPIPAIVGKPEVAYMRGLEEMVAIGRHQAVNRVSGEALGIISAGRVAT